MLAGKGFIRARHMQNTPPGIGRILEVLVRKVHDKKICEEPFFNFNAMNCK